MYFIFNGKDSREFGITVLKQPEIITPQHRTWTTFVDGYDGAHSSHLGYHPYDMTFEIAVEGEENINRIMQWLQGEGKFIRSDFPDRYINVYIQQGIQFSYTVEWLYVATVEMVAYDPFWYPVTTEWQGPFENNHLERGWESFRARGESFETEIEYAPEEIFEEGYKRNLFTSEGWEFFRKYAEEIESKGTKYLKFKENHGNGGNDQLIAIKNRGYKSRDGVYTLSGRVRVEGEVPEEPYFLLINNRGRKVLDNYYDKSTGYFSITQEVSDYSWTIHARSRNTKKDRVVELFDLKYSIGEGHPYWTPAWEDLPSKDKPVKVVNGAAVKVETREDGLYDIYAYGEGGVTLESNSEGEFVSYIENMGEKMVIGNKALETLTVEEGEEGEYRLPTYRRLSIKNDEGNLRFRATVPYIVDGVKDINYEREKALKPFATNKIIRKGGV